MVAWAAAILHASTARRVDYRGLMGHGADLVAAPLRSLMIPVVQSDVEDRTVVLEGDERTIRSVLDTLTSSCMQ